VGVRVLLWPLFAIKTIYRGIVMTNQIDLQTIKDWFTLMVAIIATIAGVIFWVQSINDPKFEKIEKEIQTLRDDITQIRTDNNEILRIVGRLEGKLESK
jgi:Na+/melibiose symporter-like transporter